MLRLIRLQELGCFLLIAGIAILPPVFLNRWPIPFVLHAYLTSVVLIFLNSLRTLASHRWSSDGQEMNFIGQMLDSVTHDNDSWTAVLLNPVGLRYHAAHHLFPSMPYHNIRVAHQRLMAVLPANSPYRATVERSIWSVVQNLLERAGGTREQERARQSLVDLEANGDIPVNTPSLTS
jgi:fatty acid desaturase